MSAVKLHRPLRVCLLSAGVLAISVLSKAAGTYDAEAARLAEWMQWTTGETVAEIGAGEGQMSFYAATVVGATGHVTQPNWMIRNYLGYKKKSKDEQSKMMRS